MQASRVNTLFRQLVRRQVQKRTKAHSTTHIACYNDLPQPQGSWQTHHDAMQRKYNSQLLLGIAALAGTLVAAQAGGLLYLNYNEPSAPADNITYGN